MTTASQPPAQGAYLRAGDVAHLLHVSPKTVARWAAKGMLPYVRTLGGHRRFSAAQIQALIEMLDRVDAPAGSNEGARQQA